MPELVKLFPVFSVRDLDEAIRYYTEKLGFSVEWTWGQPPTRAGVSLNGVEIQLDAAHEGGQRGPSVVYCHMVDVEGYYRACAARGASMAMELGNRPWGMRDFRVTDPCGNRLGFGEPL